MPFRILPDILRSPGYTDCRIVLKLQVNLVQGSVHAGLHHLNDVVLHTRKHYLRLRIAKSCVVFQHLRTICRQHETEENDALEGVLAAMASTVAWYTYFLQNSSTSSVEGAWGKRFPFRRYSGSDLHPWRACDPGRNHGLDGLSVHKESTEPSRPVINSSITMVFPAEPNFLSSIISLTPASASLKRIADQHALPQRKAVGLQHDRKFCLRAKIGKRFPASSKFS